MLAATESLEMCVGARHSTVAYVFICIQLAPLAMRSYVCISLV